MKKAPFHILFLFLMFLGMQFNLGAQQAPGDSLLRAPLFREQLLLSTDRNLYAAGGRILFRVFNLSDPALKENQWSMVLYLELINGRQVAVARGKYTFGSDGASGQLHIPDTLTTGNYALRAYTRWMRNFTAGAFASLPLGVVNARQPGNETVNPAGPEPIVTEPVPEDTGEPQAFRTTGAAVSCAPEKGSYRKREQVTLRLQGDGVSLLPDDYAVSVVMKTYLDPDQNGLSKPGRATFGEGRSVQYLPETRGISVAGKIVQRENREPVPFAALHVTLLGDAPDYFEISADQQGHIRFCIPPRPGVSNALVAFDRDKGASLELVLEEAFSRDFPVPPVPFPDLIHQRPEAVNELAMISQLREVFDLPMTSEASSADSLTPTQFYGTPEHRYRPGDFVGLPSLGEFFFELVPQVSARKFQGERFLSVMDDAGFFLEYTPLILLDHVAIEDLETLLAIDPALVETIDIVNTVYIRGSNTYGGIISILSKHGNLAGAGLPVGATIIDLQTVEGQNDPWPQSFRRPFSGERLPDLRTTLYWEPKVQLGADEMTELKFRASDIPGTYAVRVIGVTPAGKVIQSLCEFVVE